jgi:quercetin dioxygenase-like cupin family protein
MRRLVKNMRPAVGSHNPSHAMFVGAAIAASFAFWPGPVRADSGTSPRPGVVKDLMARDLIGAANKEVQMVTVEYLARGASLPHRHHAQVFVYVLEGTVRMQIAGAAAVTLGPGDVFYEGPEDVHTVSANASETKPARILVFLIKDKGAAASSPVAPGDRP